MHIKKSIITHDRFAYIYIYIVSAIIDSYVFPHVINKCRRQGRQLLPEVRGTERRNGPVSMGLMTIDQAITDLGHGVSTPLKMFRKRW